MTGLTEDEKRRTLNDDLLTVLYHLIDKFKKEDFIDAEGFFDLDKFKDQKHSIKPILGFPSLGTDGGQVLSGGGGIVIECINVQMEEKIKELAEAEMEPKHYALKVPRPSLYKDEARMKEAGEKINKMSWSGIP